MADDDLDQDDQDDLVPRSHIRQLEEKAKKATELEARLALMERETTFARALGGNEHPARSYFEKGYDGELDVDSIRNAAKQAGLFANSEAPRAAVQQEDMTGASTFASNAAGSDGPGKQSWQDALAEADRISNEAEREAAILDVVERFGGVTSRTAQ